MKKKPLIAVVGPTASGKTKLAIDIARKYGGEIVSCDSMQIYKGMKIGTAQPTEDELRLVPHHLIAFLDPEISFSVSDYVDIAKKEIEKLYAECKVPVLAGGTGLYARSLIYGANFTENSGDEKVRAELEARAESEGVEVLYRELHNLDPQAAELIHVNNEKRVIRALEYCLVTGEKFSEQSRLAEESEYDFIMIGLNYRDRDRLYERINLRVDIMMEDGLAEEAKVYYDKKDKGTSAQAIGYKELFPYFDGKLSLEEAVENIKLSTRHYAKRQLTWFRKERKISWLYPDDYSSYEELFESACKLIESSDILL
ncbi:MAG: tRNA (adenosine(37)-N6)-dimethylallyltransferase MiaA [Clostridia bacterium]|nr:tRNA (adenosine(37)-N6)-dimethylallyltransferase MiaA [Clostridia bacterium]